MLKACDDRGQIASHIKIHSFLHTFSHVLPMNDHYFSLFSVFLAPYEVTWLDAWKNPLWFNRILFYDRKLHAEIRAFVISYLSHFFLKLCLPSVFLYVLACSIIQNSLPTQNVQKIFQHMTFLLLLKVFREKKWKDFFCEGSHRCISFACFRRWISSEQQWPHGIHRASTKNPTWEKINENWDGRILLEIDCFETDVDAQSAAVIQILFRFDKK